VWSTGFTDITILNQNTTAISHSSDTSDTEKENQPINNHNFGHRIEGLWVLDLGWKNGDVLEL